MTGQLLGHYNLVLSGVTPPLALMLADEILVRQRYRPRTLGLLAALLAVVQYFIAQEFLLTEAIVAVILGVVLAVTHRDAVRSHLGFVRSQHRLGGSSNSAVACVPDMAAVPRA